MTTKTANLVSNAGGKSYADRLTRLLARSTTLTPVSLLCVHAAGCLLVLSPPLVGTAAVAAAIHFAMHAQGPLDWFLAAVLSALGLGGAILGAQLFTLRPPPPRGVVIGNRDAPELVAMLERRSARFKCPASTILLTTTAELRMVASPVSALPFIHRHSLRIGAPLLFFLGRYPFRLALASAVAASAARQAGLTGWLRQASDDWPLILATLERSDSLLSRLFAPPLGAVTRASTMLAGPLQRDWRLEQAQWLIEHSNEQNVIEYLASQVVAAAFLKRRYWPMILKAAERCPTPVVKAFSHLPLLLNKTLTRTLAERWLVQAQSPGRQYRFGVPDLLAELNIDQLRWAGPPEPNAYSALFRSDYALKQLDILWQEDIEPEWCRRHARFQNDQTRFLQLRRRAAENALRDESALRYIQLAPHFLEAADAVSAYRAAYAANTDDPKVCFAAGLALLRAGAAHEGALALQRACELQPELTERVSALIQQHRSALAHKEIFNDDSAMQSVCA